MFDAPPQADVVPFLATIYRGNFYAQDVFNGTLPISVGARGGRTVYEEVCYNRAKGKNRAIWALGLHNPYTFAVQPGTGRIYINDVGQKMWEEINRGVKGANYGWPKYEGPERDRKYRAPIFAYRHGNTGATGCAITGGAFYNPVKNTFGAAYQGDYFFGDYCSGWIRRYDPRTDRSYTFARTPQYGLVDLQVSWRGDLYYLHHGTNSLHKISKR